MKLKEGANMRQFLKFTSILALSVLMGWISGIVAGRLSMPETVHTYSSESDLVSFNLPFRKPKPTATQETPIEVIPLGLTIGVRINT